MKTLYTPEQTAAREETLNEVNKVLRKHDLLSFEIARLGNYLKGDWEIIGIDDSNIKTFADTLVMVPYIAKMPVTGKTSVYVVAYSKKPGASFLFTYKRKFVVATLQSRITVGKKLIEFPRKWLKAKNEAYKQAANECIVAEFADVDSADILIKNVVSLCVPLYQNTGFETQTIQHFWVEIEVKDKEFSTPAELQGYFRPEGYSKTHVVVSYSLEVVDQIIKKYLSGTDNDDRFRGMFDVNLWLLFKEYLRNNNLYSSIFVR